MDNPYVFDLPPKSKKLTSGEYVNLVNRIRGNFLSYVSDLDAALTVIISDLFLRDQDDFALWSRTVFDDDRTASFGAKIVWLGRIMANHPDFKKKVNARTRKEIQNRLNEIRKIRNDFAHTSARNKEAGAELIKKRVIRMYDFEEGVSTPKLFKIEEIMGMISDPWIPDQMKRLGEISRKIRES